MKSREKYILNSGITLVLGGGRSGKSKFAESLVQASDLKPIYLATARAEDDEMRERITLHQERREQQFGSEWQTIEEPLALADALRSSTFSGHAILVDCLTLWITNLMLAEAHVDREIENLVQTISHLEGPIVLVSNEVGLGGVGENKMVREFGDYAGLAHQKIAAISSQVFFVAAGIPLVMKSED